MCKGKSKANFRELCMKHSLLANAAFSAVLRAMLTILAILAGVTRVRTRASRRENIERNLMEEKNRQNNLRKDHKES
jgi:hypothetical protein